MQDMHRIFHHPGSLGIAARLPARPSPDLPQIAPAPETGRLLKGRRAFLRHAKPCGSRLEISLQLKNMIYTYIYIERERECVYTYICIHNYIHIYIYTYLHILMIYPNLIVDDI